MAETETPIAILNKKIPVRANSKQIRDKDPKDKAQVKDSTKVSDAQLESEATNESTHNAVADKNGAQPQETAKKGKKGKKGSKEVEARNETKPNQTAVSANKKVPLFDQLGQDMADRLVSQVKAPESMSLLERLSHAQRPTAIAPCTAKAPDDSGDNDPAENGGRLAVDHSSISIPSNASSKVPAKPSKKRENDINTFTLDDFAALSALASLVERFGRVSHMGVLDPSYSFFMNKDRDAALYYKVKDKIAVVGGDPLCRPDQFPSFLEEFRKFRKHKGWGWAFLGATDDFVRYAKQQKKWVTMRFGTERVLNPLTNPVLQEKAAKSIITKNKQLLDPTRGGIRVDTYSPAQGKIPVLQTQLVAIYNSWRENRNQSGQPQAYMTVFDPFALPDLMTYIYTTDTKSADGRPNGFAALRKLGANNGYHIDPYCAAPDAPRGITDLLIFSAMSLLNRAGVEYLSFGFEPLAEVVEIHAMNRPMARITKTFYRRAFRGLPIGLKKNYHDKFRPDEALESGLHLVYPDGVPGLRHMLACLHIANISAKKLVAGEIGREGRRMWGALQSEHESRTGRTDEQQGEKESDATEGMAVGRDSLLAAPKSGREGDGSGTVSRETSQARS